MEAIRPSEGHSWTGECGWMDKSEHGNNLTEPGALTDWRAQMDKQVRTRKQSDRGRGTYELEHRQTDKSGHGNNQTEGGALTNWRAQTNRQVRTWKQFDRARGTHRLESTDGWTSQDTETIQPSEGHSLPGERRRTDKSGHGNNPTEQGALTSWRTQGRTSQDTETI